MLSFVSVTKRYGSVIALRDVSIEIASGEFFGLLGPNGAGKSTLMSLAAGLREPDAGSVNLDGVPLDRTKSAARGMVGFVPQSIALYEDLTAEKNLHFFGALYGLGGRVLRTRIAEVLEVVQLADRSRDPVGVFSGGMQRRLNLAASLLHRPKLLLCDEPSVGIDPQSRNAIFEVLERLNAEGLTIVYSTHYMEEATRLCSRIGIIDHGQILALDALEPLLTRLPFEDEVTFPATAATATLAAGLASAGEVASADGVYRFRPRPDYSLGEFYSTVDRIGLSPRLFTHQRPTLEALFLHLTGRTLRE
jgi:ABC-2 type transport system ATP-binding protein